MPSFRIRRQVSWKSSRLAVLTNVNRLANGAMEPRSKDIQTATSGKSIRISGRASRRVIYALVAGYVWVLER